MSPMVRAIAVIGAVAALVTSITLAALSSTATLTGNTIASATAELLVDSDGDATFESSDGGFVFDDVVPGGSPAPVPGHDFDLQNNGDVEMDISVSIPLQPTGTNIPDFDKVDAVLSCTTDSGTTTFSVTASLQELFDTGAAMTGDTMLPAEVAECTAQVQMDADAVSGSEGSVDPFDLEFTGTNVVTP